MSKKNLLKAAGIVMLISFVSKVIGFLRDSMIASAFGATYQNDAYIMSLTIPNILFGIFGAAITTVFIPMLSESYSQNDKKGMFEFANSIMNILLLISCALFFVGWLTTPQLVKIIAPNFAGKTYDLTVTLTKLSILNIIFLSMTSGYTAILQTMEEFTAPALVGIAANVPIILYIIFGSKQGIQGLTVVTMVGYGIQILVQIPWLIKSKYKYSFKINFKDSRIKKMLLLIAPVIIGTGVNQINTLVQNNMASGLAEGSIVALDYANKLHGMIYFTFASAIVTVIYPSLSRDGSSSDFTSFKSHMTTAVNNINLILLPSAIGLIILRVPIISILFMHGKFDQRGVNMTSVALLYLVSGIVFWGVRDVFNRAFYAIQDTKTPMLNGVIGVGFNIVMSIMLVKVMGIGGLTLATTLAAFFCCVLLVISLRKKIGSINGMDMFITGLKIFASSLVMGIVVYALNKVLSYRFTGHKGEIIILAVCIGLGGIVYSIMLTLLKVKEFSGMVNLVKAKLKIG